MINECKDKKMVGSKGVVAQVKKESLDKPAIILLKDGRGEKLKPPIKLDLALFPDVKIQFIPLKEMQPTV
jgi:hypothetical protein